MAGLVPPPDSILFDPADHQLITRILQPRIAGAPGARFIHEADAYSAAPADLVDGREHAPGTHKLKCGGHWYFFSPARRHETRNGGGRRQRAVGEGYTWHSEGGEKAVLDDDDRRVGYKRSLSYVFRKSPREAVTRLGWCMTEFGVDARSAGLVLCKVYKTPRAAKTTTATSCSTAVSKKRKAAEDGDHPEAPRLQTPRRPEMDLQEIERFLLFEEDGVMPPGATYNGVVDPAGIFTDILDEVVQAAAGPRIEAAEEDDGRSKCTFQELVAGYDDMDVACRAPARASVLCGSGSVHVMAECWTKDCEICMQEMVEVFNANPW